MPELVFPMLTLCSETITDKTPIPPPDWEALIAQIADDIVQERSPARLLQVRAKLYDLLTHCIPPTTILKVLSLGPRTGLLC
jgi:replication factor C subunit 3/5